MTQHPDVEVTEGAGQRAVSHPPGDTRLDLRQDRVALRHVRSRRIATTAAADGLMTLRLAVLLGVSAIAVTIAALAWLPGVPVVGYAALFVGSSVLFLVTAPAILRASLSRRQLASLLALLFLLRAAFLFTTPIGSDDFHRYCGTAGCRLRG